MSTTELDERIEAAAEVIKQSEALLITAGAGMGVDSGLPDFRGNEGFWRAYPPMKRLGISFIEMANPGWFDRKPELAWGFYGHRLNLYRETIPHSGFEILLEWAYSMNKGCFVFTSNVDGQFQIAGFEDERVVECHGSIHHLQCVSPCMRKIWDAQGVEVNVDEESFCALEPLPECPSCGGLARPNVLMFGDWSWISTRSQNQEMYFSSWLNDCKGSNLVIIEIGAGTAVPTVRYTSEQIAKLSGNKLIRINLREAQVPEGHIGISAPAKATLTEINKLI